MRSPPMSNNTAHLALLFDAPLQSWGVDSRFRRRDTGAMPSRSAVLGLCCAALGLDKGSPAEREFLAESASLRFTFLALPRESGAPALRLTDFHTTEGALTAEGKKSDFPVISHRTYLTDAKFGSVISGPHALVNRVADAVKDPVWGVWLGRKACIPAAPVFRALEAAFEPAVAKLTGGRPLDEFTHQSDAADDEVGYDTLPDGAPSSFATRDHAPRRVTLHPASRG